MGVSVISIKVPVLQAGQEYTQDKRDRFNVSLPVDKVRGLTWGDKAATLYVEESDDGSTWVATKTTAIVAKTTADTGWVTLSKRYYRFRIKNGAATQGSIILYQQIVGLGEHLSSDTQASVVVADHGIPGANPVPVELTGSIATTISSPVTGIKTVTATAAEVFAGATRKANRRKLIIRNEDPVLRFRVGTSDVTQQNGFPVEPGATIIFEFDPKTAVPIYAISEGAALKVGVCEE